MKTKQVLLSIAIFIGGGVCGFFLADRLLADKWAKLANEEIDSVKEAFGRRLDDLYEETISQESDDPDYSDMVGTPISEAYKVVSDTTRGRVKTPYHELAKSEIDLTNTQLFSQDNRPPAPIRHNVFDDRLAHAEAVADEDSDDDVDACTDACDMTTSKDMTGVDRRAPYLITGEQYEDEFPHHDKLSAYYYSIDDVVTDDMEILIDDIDTTIGWDVFPILERQTSAWVRNEVLRTDYEICVIKGCYTEIVLGAKSARAMSPREVYLSKQRSKGIDEPSED